MQPKPDYTSGSDYHERRRHLQPEAMRCLETAVSLFGAPESILDVGCGEGALVEWCRRKDIDAVGVDLAVPEGGLRPYVHHDLRTPLDLAETFEWVLCWEVAEHLPADASEQLCDSLVRHLASPQGRLLFTAAVPGQRGPGHINCRPLAYWRGLFESRGLTWMASESMILADVWVTEVRRAPWYGRNLMIFGWT